MAGEQTKAFIAQERKNGASDQEISLKLLDQPRFVAGLKRANEEKGVTNRQFFQGLGLNLPERKPVDLDKVKKEAMRDEAKKAGPTKAWQSALLGASDLGAGVVQGALYAKDAVFGGDSYKKFTNERKDIENFHDLKRQENNQGFDGWRLGGQIASTAPMAALGRGYQGAKILSKAGAKVTAQNGLLGAAIGGAGFAENAEQRKSNAIAGGVGGAAGGVVGHKVGQKVSNLITRVTPSNASVQNIDKVINSALKNSSDDAVRGLTVTDLSSTARESLRNEIKSVLKKGKSADSQTVERMAIFNDLKASGVNLKPTGKQATGNPKLWTKETELSKLDGGDALNNNLSSI